MAPSSPKKKRGRPKSATGPRTVRISLRVDPETEVRWRDYVKRKTPSHYAAPNMSLVFRVIFEAALAAEENP